jgi:hypothetical protein
MFNICGICPEHNRTSVALCLRMHIPRVRVCGWVGGHVHMCMSDGGLGKGERVSVYAMKAGP